MDIFARFSKAVLLPGFVVIALFAAVPANAQQTATPTKDVKTDLKSSLTDLSSLYQKEVDRLEKQQEQSKSLYNDGLISRGDFENGEQALACARAKVEQVTKEIAAANQPVPELSILSDSVASSAAVWSTGNARIDNLIRHYGKQYGVDPFLIYCTMSQESGFTSASTDL